MLSLQSPDCLSSLKESGGGFGLPPFFGLTSNRYGDELCYVWSALKCAVLRRRAVSAKPESKHAYRKWCCVLLRVECVFLSRVLVSSVAR